MILMRPPAGIAIYPVPLTGETDDSRIGMTLLRNFGNLKILSVFSLAK